MARKNDELEQKTFPFEIKQLSEEGVFEGYAAIFGKKDRFGEIIEKGAFTKTLQEKKILPLLWYHDPRNPIGIVTDIKTDPVGLLIRGQLNLEVQSAREKYSLMKQKAIRGLSFGYRTVKDLWEGQARRLLEVKLFEVSPCTFQMQPRALVRSVKSEEEIGIFQALDDVQEYLEGFEPESKSGKMISAANYKLINNAMSALTAILKKLDPSIEDSQPAKKGLLDSIFEALEIKDNPQPQLFDSVFKALEN